MSQQSAADRLQVITELSHAFGGPDFVKGGGGNTSCKSADTLWVKPSGTTLAGLTPETFVAMDRARLAGLYALRVPADATAREAMVKDAMMAAVKPGSSGRPSVEAPLHDLFRATYVVHTHAVLVNGMTCSKQAEAACARLFPEALWMPYTDPGFVLCLAVRKRMAEYEAAHGRQPAVLILENHGVFVAGDRPEDLRAAYDRILAALGDEYRKAGIPTDLQAGAAPSAAAVEETRARLADLLEAPDLTVAAGPPCKVAKGPLTPDHIVYAKAFPYAGPLTSHGLADFKARRGYAPRVVSTEAGVFGVAPSPKQAQLALELALDGARVAQLAAAFGGPHYLGTAAREFIEHWEVESYRAQQLK